MEYIYIQGLYRDIYGSCRGYTSHTFQLRNLDGQVQAEVQKRARGRQLSTCHAYCSLGFRVLMLVMMRMSEQDCHHSADVCVSVAMTAVMCLMGTAVYSSGSWQELFAAAHVGHGAGTLNPKP